MAKELRNKLAVVGLTGMVFAGGIVGLSSIASAQPPTLNSEAGEADEAEHIDGDYDDGEHDNGEYDNDLSMFDGLAEGDQDLILEFEDCLAEAGLGEDFDDEHFEGDEGEIEAFEIDVDGIFATCEVVLDDLSFDADEWLELGPELSAEDEAVFEEYDECMSDALGEGIEAELEEGIEADWTDEDYERFEAAAETCDEILEDLSFDEDDWILAEDAELFEENGELLDDDFIELSEEDEAVFEEFDNCISDATGIDLDDEGDWTEENMNKVEAAFEDCEPILEELSEDAGFMVFDSEHIEGEHMEGEHIEGEHIDGEAVEAAHGA